MWDAILAHCLAWLTQEASSSTVHRPRLNHTCVPVSRGTEQKKFATAELPISPPPPSYQKPHFHCSSLLSKFKPSLLLTGSSASSPMTLLLAAPPPHRLPFFLQHRLLADDPSSCSAASSPATLLLAASPPRRRPFFLQRRLLTTNPSSCCAVDTSATYL